MAVLVWPPQELHPGDRSGPSGHSIRIPRGHSIRIPRALS